MQSIVPVYLTTAPRQSTNVPLLSLSLSLSPAHQLGHALLGFKALLTFEPQVLFLVLGGQRAGSIAAVAEVCVDVGTKAKDATQT